MRLTRLLAQSPKAFSQERTRDLVLAVMRTTATKREARQFISKYGFEGSESRSSPSRPFRLSLIRLSAHDAQYNDPELGKALGSAFTLLMDLGANPIIVLDAQPEMDDFLRSQDQSFNEVTRRLFLRAENWASLVEQSKGRAVPVYSSFQTNSQVGTTACTEQALSSLKAGIIPILCPISYDQSTTSTVLVDANRAVRAIVDAFVALPDVAVDKVVFIDPLGGLPSVRRKSAHILVNLRQEFGEINAEILSSSLSEQSKSRHLANLDAMNDILSSLEASASGIITTPRAAGAVMDRNPIIYNLLTDRPLISPSLPLELHRTQLVTSVLRAGFPVRVLFSKTGFDLSKEAKIGRLNMSKLVNLINRSFGKTLDLEHYLNRIGDRTAALIIVGDYDGAAIITYETSPSGRPIAYLDKFAVHPKSQGATGVADIMLIHMVRRLFPKEVIWRSRQNNPVNKWYFERSRGFIRVPGTQWVVFWNSSEQLPPLEEYVEVCRDIEPSLR